MSKAARLHTLHATGTLPAALWQQFTTKAAAAGYGPTAALARLIRRYVARGFDDGQPEQTGAASSGQPDGPATQVSSSENSRR